MKVLLVDDEVDVLLGLKSIIDWNALGIDECITSSSSVEALDIIKNQSPDIVVIDINMPIHTGLDVMKLSRQNNFLGHFFILSGASEFEYAQRAINYGATMYLTKPVDEDELFLGLQKSIKEIKNSYEQSNFYNNYFNTAKYEILKNILLGNVSEFQNILKKSEHYQIVMYHEHLEHKEENHFHFTNMFEIFCHDNINFETIKIDNYNIAILIGMDTIKRFSYLINYYDKNIERKSPLDSLFLIYGTIENDINDIYKSYETVLKLLKYRFFMDKNKHTLGFEFLNEHNNMKDIVIDSYANYTHKLVENIKINKKDIVHEILSEIKETFMVSNYDEQFIKNYIADLLISIREKLKIEGYEIPVQSNFTITNTINNIMFIHELFYYFNKQLTILLNSIVTPSDIDIIDTVTDYINNNFDKDLKLDYIAKIYNYNPAYLGKLFTKKVGMNFNSFVEIIRINHAKELLADGNLKIYEVSNQCGYKNVDYFNRKFKKHTGVNPSKYKSHEFLNS